MKYKDMGFKLRGGGGGGGIEIKRLLLRTGLKIRFKIRIVKHLTLTHHLIQVYIYT
jgi:DUF917 family protein